VSTIKEIQVPDLGNTSKSEVIEIAVAVGDIVRAEDTLITLESEKASMDIPSPYAGTVKAIKTKVGDKLGTGSLILMLEVNEAGAVAKPVEKPAAPEPAVIAISEKARNKALTGADMQGSCFTISSLGGIGGTAFTPIINLPDVAILGVSKAAIKPVYKDNQFVPRLILPLSLSYDHRVIDGAEGARFTVHLARGLADIRQLLL
jgi:Pyruvate/2-oxoglutarate dehydrogenase complex, dihydrolipoamide acyltransferase (E2) component, and related enzymes